MPIVGDKADARLDTVIREEIRSLPRITAGGDNCTAYETCVCRRFVPWMEHNMELLRHDRPDGSDIHWKQ
jgi:hypothetical protein